MTACSAIGPSTRRVALSRRHRSTSLWIVSAGRRDSHAPQTARFHGRTGFGKDKDYGCRPSRGPAENGGPAERDLQQRQLLEHRHRREGRHPDLQRRRRADAGLHGRRGDEQDHAGRHFRSAGSDRARQGAERRARHPDHAGLRGAGVQGLARDRGHLRADLHPQGREPLPGGGVGDGAARRAGRHHRLPADRHRQHRAQAGGRGAAQGRGPAERDLQQRQLLEHRHRRQGRHPDLQRRRRADAGLHGRRGDEQDHAGRHLRSAGSDRARQGAERRARHADHARASRRWCSRPRAGSRTSTS